MPPKFRDLVGWRVGKLKVIKLADFKRDRCFYWECLCDCGKITNVKATCLIRDVTHSCGCLKKTHFVDLTGKTFNHLTLKTLLGKNKSNCYKYLAICSCGKEFSVEGNDVSSGKLKSCGHTRLGNQLKEEQYKEALYRALYRDYECKAEKREYQFELELEEFVDIVKSPCVVCNHPHFNTKTDRKHKVAIQYNGIDRIDNDIGYLLANCQAMCMRCNQAKHQMTQPAFKSWTDEIFSAKLNKLGIWRL